ncbi:MAG: hypothetical protein C1941_05095 [Prosthecochloris sp.]|nr:hypothetical protein [Prosthecochloris sp.]
MSLGDSFSEKDREDFAASKVSVGTVLKLKVFDTNPPKEKRFIIVSTTVDGLVLATVYINTKINTVINYSTELQALHIPLKEQGREFLNQDSYVDSSRLITRDRDEIEKAIQNRPDVVIGEVSIEDFQLIRKTIISAPTIKGKYKKKFGFYA